MILTFTLLLLPFQPYPPLSLKIDIMATFIWNWHHCENGNADPVVSVGCTTYMGPPTSERAGQGAASSNADGSVLVFVAERLRTCGLSIIILPEDSKEDEVQESAQSDGGGINGRRKRQKTETKPKTLRERELALFRSRSISGGIKVFDANQKLVAFFKTMGVDDPWLFLSCMNDEVSNRIYEALKSDFDLAIFPHETESIDVDDLDGSYRLDAVTGDKFGSDTKNSITTLFSLYRSHAEHEQPNDLLVAKALCSYENSEINCVGPTLEMIETAQEWQHRGLGTAMIQAIEIFYKGKFEEFRSRVWFSVCRVTSYEVMKWLKGFGFRGSGSDFDCLGDDLLKVLNDEEFGLSSDSDDESEEVIDY
jgi:hypothetical protein